jgi:hypothetical protein
MDNDYKREWVRLPFIEVRPERMNYDLYKRKPVLVLHMAKKQRADFSVLHSDVVKDY